MVNKRALREMLVSSWNRDELITLATDIAENAELVLSDGGTLETWARELVAWCGRRSKLEILVDRIKKDRPEIYRIYEKELEYKTKPPTTEIQSRHHGIGETFGVRKPVEEKNASISPEPKRSAKLRVFLCHSSEDKTVVREFYHHLIAAGWIDPWLDEEKLLPGMDWNTEIEKAVKAANAVIVFLSNNSVTKEGYVQRELKYVLDIALEKPEGTIFIIPVRLEDCQPPRRLRTWQYVDVFPLDKKDWAIKRIIASLEIRAQGVELP